MVRSGATSCETQSSATAKRTSQRKAGPAARTELRDPLPYSRYSNREAPLHALPSTAACGKRKLEPFRPLPDTWGRRPICSEENALYISSGRVLFAAQESLVLSTCGQNERFLLAYALRGGPFQRFFALGEPFLPKPHFYGAISREESFILSRGGQNERLFAVHERKRPLRPR